MNLHGTPTYESYKPHPESVGVSPVYGSKTGTPLALFR